MEEVKIDSPNVSPDIEGPGTDAKIVGKGDTDVRVVEANN